MAGIDWAALPLIIELLDHDDPEALVEDLITIREHMQREQAHG